MFVNGVIRQIKIWFKSMAGRISIVMILLSSVMLIIAWFALESDFLSVRGANFSNNILIGIATNLIGIVFTVSFVQFFLDKQNEKEECEYEIETIKRYDKYMQTLIRRYLMFYVSVTTRIEKRGKTDIEQAYDHQFAFSDIADMYKTSLYMSEGFTDSSIELFYKAEENIRNYMLRMLENIDFKYQPDLERILLDFVTKSVNFDMRGQILGAIRTTLSKNQKSTEYISKEIANEKNDWIGKFKRNELQGNMFLPYVIFYYGIQDQMRLLREYRDCIASINSFNKEKL